MPSFTTEEQLREQPLGVSSLLQDLHGPARVGGALDRVAREATQRPSVRRRVVADARVRPGAGQRLVPGILVRGSHQDQDRCAKRRLGQPAYPRLGGGQVRRREQERGAEADRGQVLARGLDVRSREQLVPGAQPVPQPGLEGAGVAAVGDDQDSLLAHGSARLLGSRIMVDLTLLFFYHKLRSFT
jgi:hypothetical protein